MSVFLRFHSNHSFAKPGVLILGLLLLCLPVGAQEELDHETILVRYPSGMLGAAQRIQKIYPRLKEDCERKLGFLYRRKLRLWLVRNHDDFNEIVERLGSQPRPGHVAAIAFPHQDIVVLKSSAWTRQTGPQFEITFQHEIAHCLLGHMRRNHRTLRIPVWLDEGIAQWLSEPPFGRENQILLRAMHHDALIPFADLTKRFPTKEGPAQLAYAQSESFVNFIATYDDPEGRKRNLNGLLLLMATGLSFNEASLKILGRSQQALVAEWLGQNRPSLPIPLQSLPEILFALVLVILALLAWATHRVRRSEALARMAAEDHQEDLTIERDEKTAGESTP